MQLDNKLESYVQNVTAWWAWSFRRLKYGPVVAAEDMARAYLASGYKPAYQA